MAGMKPLESLDILTDSGLQLRVARLSVAVAVVALVLAVLIAVLGAGERVDVWWWVALALGCVLPLPVHELVHGAAFKLLCPGCRVSFGFKDAFLYTNAHGITATRGRMVAVLLAPAAIVTVALLVACLSAGRPVLAVILAGVHLAGCAGDILMALEALREPRCTHVRDTDVGIDLLSDGRKS